MTDTLRMECYASNACIDREDAEALPTHLAAIVRALGGRETALTVDGADHETALHYARAIRIIQRATQPNVVAMAAAFGVERLTTEIRNGQRCYLVRRRGEDLILDATRRTVRMVGRHQPQNQARQAPTPAPIAQRA